MGEWPQDLTDMTGFGLLSTAGEGSPAVDALANGGYATGQSSFQNNGTWPVANLAMYIPVLVRNYITVYQLGYHSQAPAGNVDIGIYDKAGVRRVSSGSTVMTSPTAVYDVTDTPLVPGLYYLALALDNASASVFGGAIVPPGCRVMGCLEQASALPLPANATFAPSARNFVPLIFGSIAQAII